MKVIVNGIEYDVTPEVARVLSYDPNALSGARKQRCFEPNYLDNQKPNVELFDDPQHNGQYWGN